MAETQFEMFPVEIIPVKKELKETIITKEEVKNGVLKFSGECLTNIRSLTQLKDNVRKAAIAMLFLELFETEDENGEIDFDYDEADQFLRGARNIKHLQISESRDLINGANSGNVVKINTGLTDLASGKAVYRNDPKAG